MYGFDEFNENKSIINNAKISANKVNLSIEKLKQLNILDRREEMFKQNGEDLSRWKAPWIIFWTGHLSVSKKECIKLGGFDEAFDGWGYEDIDLGIRWFLNHYNLIMSRTTTSIHLPHDKFKATLEANDRKLYSNSRKQILFEKYNLKALKLWMNHETIEIEKILKGDIK